MRGSTFWRWMESMTRLPGADYLPVLEQSFGMNGRSSEIRDGIGAHLFSASNITSEQALVEEFRSVLRTALSTFGAARIEPPLIDLGDGFAAPFAAPGERPVYTGLCAVLEELLAEALPR